MLAGSIDSAKREVRRFVQQRYGIELEALGVESPPRVELGDLALPFPFQLAKHLRRPPRQIADEVAAEMQPPSGIERIEAAGGGYVNLFFERAPFLQGLARWIASADAASVVDGKIVVEHTNINPNKAAHIGHLRNAVLGDTFVRLLKSRGHTVEVQNYIDNTGVQVADVVVGFHYLRELTLADVKRIDDPFDFYCWDLYAEVSDWFREEESRLELRARTLHDIEEGRGEVAELADYVANRIVGAHLRTMARIGVGYDLLPRESEILHLDFWDEAFRLLKKRRAIQYVEEGPNTGCWVMQLPEEDGRQEEEKVIVRSNGTVTYVGKDIAYQMWKFGLLARDFRYRPFESVNGSSRVWVTSLQGDETAPPFGRASQVYNVIDVRQSYLQRVVVQGLRRLGFEEEAARSTHFSYEMVALSPTCCAELGIDLSEEDRGRPYVEVSGRKGLGVKADSLLDTLVERSLAEVAKRQPDLPSKKQSEIATQIAVGALRYFMLKYTRNSVIAFDFGEALSFEGETGPYLQYSAVRTASIFRKLTEADSWNEDRATGLLQRDWAGEDLGGLLNDDEVWELLMLVARIEEAVEQAVGTLEMSLVARHAFSLARQLNLFYHRHHILSEEDPARRDFLLMVVLTARLGLLRLMGLLGIDVPERM